MPDAEEHLSLCDIHACPQCLASFYVDETVERAHIQ